MNHVVSPVLSSGSKIGLLLLLTIAGWQCLEAPNYPDEPYIEFLSLSKDTMDQGIFQQDSLIVRFRFEDGDGDIGRTDADPENNIFFIDERTGTLDNTFGIPTIPEDGAGNGVEGLSERRLHHVVEFRDHLLQRDRSRNVYSCNMSR